MKFFNKNKTKTFPKKLISPHFFSKKSTFFPVERKCILEISGYCGKFEALFSNCPFFLTKILCSSLKICLTGTDSF
jgi:hypothetical protein